MLKIKPRRSYRKASEGHGFVVDKPFAAKAGNVLGTQQESAVHAKGLPRS
jgi:hypothetical protein